MIKPEKLPQTSDHELGMLDAKDIQEIFDICEKGAYDLINRPDFPCLKIGGCLRIPVKQLQEWINDNSWEDRD